MSKNEKNPINRLKTINEKIKRTSGSLGMTKASGKKSSSVSTEKKKQNSGKSQEQKQITKNNKQSKQQNKKQNKQVFVHPQTAGRNFCVSPAEDRETRGFLRFSVCI